MSDQAPLTLADLQRYIDDCPFHQALKMTVAEADRQRQSLTLRLAFSPTFERVKGSGQYHGGVIASLIDIAGNFALINSLGYGVPTINLRIDYLRPAASTDLLAKAVTRRLGRTVGVVDVDVEDAAGKLVAVGRGCYGTQQG